MLRNQTLTSRFCMCFPKSVTSYQLQTELGRGSSSINRIPWVGGGCLICIYFMGGQCYVFFYFVGDRFVLNYKLNCVCVWGGGGRILE